MIQSQSKENGNDEERQKGEAHAGVQARGGGLVEGGQSMAVAARTLGVVEQTLFNWIKAHREGKLKGADSRVKVSSEPMEISRLKAELARVKMEREILEKATACFAKGST